MFRTTRLHRLISGIVMTLGAVTGIPLTHAQNASNPILVMMPHCTETNRTLCPEFEVLDAVTLTTEDLQVGDIVDIDVVVRNIGTQKITTVRSWIEYDPTALEARNVELNGTVLPSPIPGESLIDQTNNVVKIGGANAAGIGFNDAVIARVTFRVLAEKSSILSFKGYDQFGTGETALRLDGPDSTFTSVMKTEPARLAVNIAGAPAAQSSSSVQTFSSSSAVAVSSEQQSSTPGSSAFTLLQVQNLRITSQGSDIFVGWDELKSSALQGYNVYYGTVSGRYIQRRSLPKGSLSLALRGLQSGTQYFVAVRGYDANNQETAFSQEESVVVGRPETSTAPLLGQKLDGPDGNPIQQNGGTDVPGQTGLGTTLAALLVVAALIGTMFAWRRQLTLSR